MKKTEDFNLIFFRCENSELKRPIQKDDTIYVGYSQSRNEKEVLS